MSLTLAPIALAGGCTAQRRCLTGSAPSQLLRTLRPFSAGSSAASLSSGIGRLATQRVSRRATLVRVEASDAAVPVPGPGQPAPAAKPSRRRHTSVTWVVGGAVAAAALLAAHHALTTGLATSITGAVRSYLSNSLLAKSGFFAAFSLIFLSEVGDKTFFIAALLAMRCGRWVSFAGSLAALSVMTVISVGIGFAVKRVPTVVESSEVLGQWAGAALLLYFGLRTLKDAWDTPETPEDSEYDEAEEEVSQAEKGGKISSGAGRRWQALAEVASLIFVAEWGDRSMLATIALGAAQSPLGVAGGAVLGHAVATAIAVIGGAALSEHISEKTVGYLGGTLFLVFAAATMFGLF